MWEVVLNKCLVNVILYLYLEAYGTCVVQYMLKVLTTSPGGGCSEGSLVLYTHPSWTSTSGVTVGGGEEAIDPIGEMR